MPTSPRPRHAPEIEELGWELSSATLWRDGLPRLAHTLAKAASSGTGVDPSEVELLQQQMHDVGERVLDAYPDEVDPNHVGNWQLLSAIEALIRGDKVGANYHLGMVPSVHDEHNRTATLTGRESAVADGDLVAR